MAENSAGPERRPGKRRGPLIALFAAAAVVVGAGAFAISQQPGAVPTPTATSTSTTARTEQPETPAPTNEGDDDVKLGSTNVLDEPKSGQEAIDALGDKIGVVAERNGMTVDELTHLLQTDSTVHISVTGSIYYRDTHTP